MSYNVANWLKFDCGVNPSDVIAICCDNTIWYPSFVLGIWHVGGICALLNPFYNSGKLTNILKGSIINSGFYVMPIKLCLNRYYFMYINEL